MKRAWGPIVAGIAALAWAPLAEAQWTATANTGTGVVIFTGSGINDTLAFTSGVGGALTHTAGGDPGFVGPTDLDSFTAGIQSIVVSAVTSLTVNAGLGNDTVILTGLTGVTAGTLTSINGEDGDDILTGGDADETINGGPGNDVIEAGAGNDSVFGGSGMDAIGLGTSGGEANTVDGGADVDTLGLLGDGNPNVFIISRTGGVLSISIDGVVSTATYSNLETVSIAGMGGDDTFTVEPLDDLAYAVDGAAGADTLNVDAAGNPVVQTSTTITVAGRLPIGHSAVEVVNVSNAGFSLGDDDDDKCGFAGFEGLLALGLLLFLRRRS